MAIVFLCLALGRCLVSGKTLIADAAQSAGWSFYAVAMHLLHNFLDMKQDHPMTLNGLQAYGLMGIIYLFRLDAKEKTDRAIANAISSAHVLGLHRKAIHAQMSDVDYDTRNPRNLSDEWLEQHKLTRANVAELEDEIKPEIDITRDTPIPLHAANRSTPGIVHDYLDLLLENWRQSLPCRLRYEDDRSDKVQFSGLECWQVKECLFGHMRYMSLKLQIRRSVAASTSLAATAHEGMANESARAQLACSIIRVF
ncbi:hypothetical protein EDB81DRAFT_757624 [Dactylonectria macrodidyma]|uniref:Uncharacterized protein n=1 Tax=Dactylonectria macrodidyma TaxID=307937 RepID=A0A9P9J7Q3_9HYPO|nr:hypothetical protein EDB81DRAFT_757624 [Dactylonectria macrodidyma]